MSIRAGGRIRDRTVRMMIDRWIAEATECDFKVALEVKKPKSWLKSVSAFANGIGGTLFFGIDNDRNAVGLDDTQTDAEAISRLIKERISRLIRVLSSRQNGRTARIFLYCLCPQGAPHRITTKQTALWRRISVSAMKA